MKKEISIAIILMFTSVFSFAQDIYMSKNGVISFTSHAPLEDIFAESKELSSAINIKTNKISCKLKISTLEMENSLQEEHLNEKYLESHKYPYATFTGQIEGNADWGKDGEYKVKAIGKLSIHGVELDRNIDAMIIIKNGIISATSIFKVKVAEHKVEIPKLVFQKVGEEVEVKLSVSYELLVK